MFLKYETVKSIQKYASIWSYLQQWLPISVFLKSVGLSGFTFTMKWCDRLAVRTFHIWHATKSFYTSRLDILAARRHLTMVWASWGLRNGYAIDCTFLLFLLYLHNARDTYLRMELVTQAHVMSSIVTVPEAHDMLMIMKQTTHANVVCPFLTRNVVRLKVRTWHTSACFTRCQLSGPKTPVLCPLLFSVCAWTATSAAYGAHLWCWLLLLRLPRYGLEGDRHNMRRNCCQADDTHCNISCSHVEIKK